MPYAHVRQIIVERDGKLRVDGLPLRRGERVQVIVIPDQQRRPAERRYPLHGTVVQYDEPFEPAVDPDEWEANR